MLKNRFFRGEMRFLREGGLKMNHHGSRVRGDASVGHFHKSVVQM